MDTATQLANRIAELEQKIETEETEDERARCDMEANCSDWDGNCYGCDLCGYHWWRFKTVGRAIGSWRGEIRKLNEELEAEARMWEEDGYPKEDDWVMRTLCNGDEEGGRTIFSISPHR